MKKVAQWSAFFLAVVVLGFLLHPTALWIIHTVNDGTTSDCRPATPDGNGWCWTSSYTRFVPSDYEHGFALGIDLAISMLFASGLFCGAMLVTRRKKMEALTPDPVPAISPTKTSGKAVTHNRRFILIPAWFLAQYIHNLILGMSVGQALDMMTSIESLWYSVIVVTVIVLYARNYKVVFGKEPEQPREPVVPEK